MMPPPPPIITASGSGRWDTTSFRPKFNGSIRVEARSERLTGEPGAIILRDVLERLGMLDWLVRRLRDPRKPELITHPLPELLNTSVLLMAQGWRDQDDADALRDDPALRLAVSTRRVVLVVLERPGELHLHHFWLITSWSPEQVSAEDLLPLYRDRGTAEGHLGELMNVLAPALSSSPRPKEHTKGQAPKRQYPSGDSFAINEVLLLLNCLAYNALHAGRVLLETATREGWSIRRLRERVLRVAARVLLHSRRVVIVIGKAAAALWEALTAGLMRLSWAGP